MKILLLGYALKNKLSIILIIGGIIMVEKHYAILESLYVIREDGELSQLESDRLFGLVLYSDKDVAINKVNELINIGNPEVTEDIPEEFQNQLPNVDALKDALELYKVVKLRNAIVSYKVLAVNTIN
jgi:hypothetical protein